MYIQSVYNLHNLIICEVAVQNKLFLSDILTTPVRAIVRCDH